MRPVPLLNRSRQRGAALLALALLLISILLGAFFSAMNSGLSNREQSASDALTEARDALAGFAATYRDSHAGQVFGYLPCPDTDNDGIADPPCGTTDVSAIGRLPWKTLGIPPLRDSAAECLWYAVSGRAKDDPKTGALNWDTLGQFVIQDASGNDVFGSTAHARPLAIIFSPRPPLNGQNRPTTTSAACGGTNVVTDYLELLDSNWATANFTGDLFIRVANADSQRTGTSNDRALWVENRDVFDRVKRRSDFKEDIDTLMNDLATYLNNLAPASLPTASGGNKGIDNVIAGYLAANPSLPTRKRKVLDNWQDNLLYAGGPTGFTYTISVNGLANTCRALLFFGGERSSTQTRSTVAERADPTMYLEGTNATTFPASGAYTGAAEYVIPSDQVSKASTDIVRCINGLGAGSASFNTPTDFSQFVAAGSGVSTDTSTPTAPVLTLADAAGTAGACFWFPGAIPLAGKTVRAYYDFQFLYADTYALGDTVLDRGNGFTLQMLRSDIGAPNLCGSEYNLGALGTTDMWGSRSYIIETDVFESSSRDDPTENHTAIHANGSLTHLAGTLSTACDGTTSGCRHAPANTFEETPVTLAHNQRVEIHSGCNSTCTSCNPASHTVPNTYARITVWVDCTTCTDVAIDIDRTTHVPTIQRCRDVSAPELNSFFFGLTSGFKSGTLAGAAPAQGVKIRNFTLRSD